MSEDLTIGEPEETEIEVETTTRSEYLAAAYNAIAAVAEIDPMTKDGQARKKRIIRRSIQIIDNIIEELHSELFETDEED